MKKLLIIGSMMALASCHSNPYQDQPLDRLHPQPVQDVATLPGYTIEAPSVVDVTEGAAAVSIPIAAHVITGDAKISFDGLPSFVQWDNTNSKLVVTAPIGASQDPNQPLDTTRKYEVIVKASSSQSPNSFIEQSIVILVHHKAETLVVKNLDSRASITEGSNYQTSFQIQSQTFPKGPFFPQTVGLPDGVSISPTTDPTIFNINYRPGFNTVTTGNYSTTCYDNQSNQHFCKLYQWTLNVTDPRGDSVSVNSNWQVLDSRQAPLIITNLNIVGTKTGATFAVQVEDPNGEVAPTVTVSQGGFGLGNLTSTIVASSATGNNGSLPYTLVNVVLAITPVTPGKVMSSATDIVNVRACVNDDRDSNDNCVVQAVTITYN